MKRLTLVLLTIFLPITIYGNAGTLLIWFIAFHLLIGNFLIGAFEGAITIKIFKTPLKRTIILLILANFASLLLGAFALPISMNSITPKDMTIENAQFWFYISILITFVITLLIEFVFYLYIFEKSKRKLKTAIKATFMINLISYIFLFAYYYYASNASFISETKLVTLNQFSIPENYEIYYISNDGKEIIKKNLKTEKSEIVKKIDSKTAYEKLFIDIKTNSLFIYSGDGDEFYEDKTKKQLIFKNFLDKSQIKYYKNKSKINDDQFVRVLYDKSNWRYQIGFWQNLGISGKNKKTNKKFLFNMETIFMSWHVSNVSVINENLLVFQLGWEQICILDPINKKIALIARGRGVVVKKVRNYSSKP